MSEEEIIESVKYHILLEYLGFCNIDKVSLQGLLDLYNELKEKNASLQKEIKLMKSININDNYISKDKIRERIKELEEKSDYWNCDEIECLQELLEE